MVTTGKKCHPRSAFQSTAGKSEFLLYFNYLRDRSLLCGLLYTHLKRVIPKNLLTASAWTATVFGVSLHGTPVDAQLLVVASRSYKAPHTTCDNRNSVK